MFTRLLTFLPVLILVSACAYSEDVADVPYTPINAAPMSGAVPLSLNVTDGRTSNRTRISVKVTGYDTGGAPIRSSRPIPDIVRDALTTEFRNRGFPLAANGRVVTVTIMTFYNSFGTSLGFSSEGDVTLNVAVTNGSVMAYQHIYTGESHTQAMVLMANGSNAAASVSNALQNAIGQMFADAAFVSALTIRTDEKAP